ncbi:ABC transporter ATP-binding protein [Lactiplantibacillus mudanjiangensis]|uniref:ABC-type quaternary amine transporter n=1 Tax=Lactiplantibacillus mudanjiangensis TaxID=1296538 RepID=A0A660E9H5_9LACO|nr:ABC transporter ATP-binding protein [Lactiplantibacillus mudanjiangensis]VDG21039.1 ABC transporter ATP-binding protein [Lactobacillus sp.] [Lactiplantibacillus mudanjiangensis]VDG26048.1 ABC transporter ATP-binding protein [Lactobacillus sp.] [Lactiplantibacillus mudanjiangensis]VDG29114.1 ABC transporter ATP-binding protein [Lactobacillus sp.] [Lactiplantibacillus mudanjiangensis]VDG31634.1 ABC transporter ATP-binding protein [Lactobacillus sp.] [Lactiplantibacillus mudanjiangensis]
MTTAIEFQHVQKSFNGNEVIPDLNLTVAKGELFVLVGTSGSGKTTSLKMINRLEPLTGGKILVNGQDTTTVPLRELRWDMGYVLQQIALFPTMTVAQNIAVIPEMKGTPKKEINATIDDLLTEVGLDPAVYRDRMPDELSGGEQQRIGILRAIASQPTTVLMDEPFSALDPISRQQLQDLVLKLHQRYDNTIVFVTHDMNEALKLGDRIGIMRHGELLQVDTPSAIAQHPVNDFVRDFFGASRAKKIYDVYVGRVGLVQGYLPKKPAVADGEIQAIDSQATLRTAFEALATHQYLAITEETQVKGYLDRQTVMTYLSTHEPD